MIRDLTTLDDCRGVVGIQHAVWGQDGETVPASLLSVSMKRGGILIGAFDQEALAGFVWSMPGQRDGRPTHWSHMLGVRQEFRGHGLAEQLKLAQRDRALAAGCDLIEWTFDPLQAGNAHFNLVCLGVTASEYRVNAYGELQGFLHRGAATDRLVVTWWIGRPHVVRRLEARRNLKAGHALAVVRDASLRDLPIAISVTSAPADGWSAPAATNLGLDDRRVLVPVPARFSDMLQSARGTAVAWRLATREVFTAYFRRGYQAVDFHLDREQGSGAYVLAR